MAANESSYHAAGMVGKFLVGASALLVILGIGYVNVWPKVVAVYQNTPVQVQQDAPQPAPAPAPRAPAPVYQPAPVIVQQVPAGEAPQPVQVQPQPAPPAPPPDTNNPPAEPPAPAPAPIVIVHQVSADGAHQTITGSGACKVARVAARCGDK